MLGIAPVASRASGWAWVYAALWASTLLLAASTATAGGAVVGAARAWLDLPLSAQNNPPPALWGVLALAAHNVRIASWPLLLGVLGTHRSPRAVRALDAIVALAALANIAPVGVALGAYGPRLLPFIPQLPLEWAALALGTSSWLSQRKAPLHLREGLVLFGLIVCLLLGAAVLERAGVPHR